MPNGGADKFKSGKKGDQRKVYPEPQKCDRSEKACPEKQLKKGGLQSFEGYIKAYEYQKEIGKYNDHYKKYKEFVKSEMQKLSDKVTDLHKQSKQIEKRFKLIKKFKLERLMGSRMRESQKAFMEKYCEIDYSITQVENRINLNQLGWASVGGKGLPFHRGPGRDYMMKLYKTDSEWDNLKKTIDNLKKLKSHIDNAQWKKSYEKQEAEKWQQQGIIKDEKYKKAESNKLDKYNNKIEGFKRQYLDIKQKIKRYSNEGQKLPEDVFLKAKELANEISFSKGYEFEKKYNYKDLEVRRSEYREKLKAVWSGLDEAMKETRFRVKWQTRNVNFGNLQGN